MQGEQYARPMEEGTRLKYKGNEGGEKVGTVIQAGYYTLWVWSDDKSFHVIRYGDIIQVLTDIPVPDVAHNGACSMNRIDYADSAMTAR